MRGSAPSLSALRPAAPSAKLLRRARLGATAVGGFLVPWSAVLAKTLPNTTQVRRWSTAWAGLDASEAVAALATSALLARGGGRGGGAAGRRSPRPPSARWSWPTPGLT
jgi:hypothetical protein